MTKVTIIALLSTAVMFLSGCLQTRNDIKEAETTQNLQSQLSTLQKNNADYVSRVEESLENSRQLNGRLEVIENKLSKVENQDGQKKAEDSHQLGELSQKVVLMQEALGKMENDLQALHAELNNVKSSANSNASSNLKASNGSGAEAYKNLYDSAEGLFKEKKWKEAILQYDDYRSKNPKGKLIPDATYKTGVCFQELGMKDESKTFYQEVLTKFPKTDIAKKASIRLKSIK